MPAAIVRVVLRGLVAVVLAVLALASAASAGGPGMLVGATEILLEQPTLEQAKAQAELVKRAGISVVRIDALWQRGARAPSEVALQPLRNALQAADGDQIRLFLAVYPSGSSKPIM